MKSGTVTDLASRRESASKGSRAPFLVFIAFLFLIAATGGSSRGDEAVILVARPITVIVTGYFVWRITSQQAKEFSALIGFLLVVCGLVGSQLVPLPPWLWHGLPGRGLVAEIDRVAGLGQVWRPISIAPQMTWNALFSLSVPLATILGFACLDYQQRQKTVYAILGIGLINCTLSALQVIGPPNGPFHIYPDTQGKFALGLFANRNHHALFLACFLPILVTATRSHSIPVKNHHLVTLASIGAMVIIIMLILLTGSRSGLFIGVLSALFSMLLLQSFNSKKLLNKKDRRKNLLILTAVISLIVGIAGLTISASRGFAVDRLIVSNSSSELRISLWRTTTELISSYFPAGSGFGAFTETYEIVEPHAALGPGYANHAHNDLLEIILAGGLPGLMLVALSVLGWGRASWLAFRASGANDTDVAFARLGSVLLFMIGVASLTDYPLRVPLITVLAVIAAAWLAKPSSVEKAVALRLATR